MSSKKQNKKEEGLKLKFTPLIDDYFIVKRSDGAILDLVYKKTGINKYNYMPTHVLFAIDGDCIVYEYVCTYYEFLMMAN